MDPQTTCGVRRRTINTLGITGAALVLSAASAFPAFAAATDGSGPGDGGPSATGEQHSQQGRQQAAANRQQAGQDEQTQPAAQSQQGQDTAASSRQQGTQQRAAHQPSSTGGAASDHGRSGAHTNAAGTAGAMTATGHNPPGNNGTVKIHDLVGDTAHHNVPHVSCDFAVDFWGFDAGQALTVSFAGQAPTGMGTALTSTAPTSITSPDEAGGGNDFDGELTFPAGSLDLAALGAPHPKQGYHVKLTVATGEPGGSKYKVFWIEPCTTVASTGTTSQGGSAPTVSGNTISTGGTTSHGSTTAKGPVAPAEVLGTRFVRTPTSATPTATAARPIAGLPFTGAEIGGLVAAAAAALGGGAALTIAGRRRRTAAQTG